MSFTTGLLVGSGVTIVGGYLVLKALRPTLRERLATIASAEVIRYAQGNGLPLPNNLQTVLKVQLMYPAIDAALDAAYLG